MPATYPPHPLEPHLMPFYDRADVPFVRGEGCWLWAEDGRKYLDFASGFAVNALGHCHPKLVAALKNQAEKLWHVSNLYRSPQQERVAKKLCDITFAERVFFQNSGVEAWELGVKICRNYQYSMGRPERFRIITFEGAFHGRTLAAIAAAKSEKMVKGFGPQTDGFDQVPFADMAALQAAITPETAAIHCEPIQGEGGIRPFSHEQLRFMRQLCDQHNLLLFFDEVQTGMGRTGKLFAYEHAEIMPDVLCSAKGLGSGFPVGACLATANAAQGMGMGMHGSTYGGNPLALAVIEAVLEEMSQPQFFTHVRARGQQLQQGFDDLVKNYPQLFAERRGLGLMQGLRLQNSLDSGQLIADLRHEGLLTVAGGENVVRLLPPLIISEAEMAQALSIVNKVAGVLATKLAA